MKSVLKLSAFISLLVLLGAFVFVLMILKTPKNNDFSEVSTVDTLSPQPLPTEEGVAQDKVQTFNLRVGEKAELSAEYIMLMDVLADSRCPAGVQCVWTGEVKIGLKYTNKTTLSSRDFTLSYPEASPTIVDGYKMEIIRVTPEKTIDPINKQMYRFQIAIERLEDGDASINPSSDKSFGELTGIVLVGPMCPVIREGQECPDKRATDVALRITHTKSGIVYTTTTDSSGAFSVSLPAGTYRIENGSTKPYPRISPVEVSVVSGKPASIVVHGDSGIR